MEYQVAESCWLVVKGMFEIGQDVSQDSGTVVFR